MINKIFLFITLFIVIHGHLNAQEIEKELKYEIEKILFNDVDIDPVETPGCIIGIILPDTMFVLSFGTTTDLSTVIDSSLIFDLGGLSKIFISLVANDLVHQNVFKRTDKLLDDFPSLAHSPIGQISFEELLTHRSGIKRELKGLKTNNARLKNQWNRINWEGFIRSLERTEIDKTKEFAYNHHNSMILSRWMEVKTGAKFYQLLENYLVSYQNLSNYVLLNNKTTSSTSGFSRSGKEEKSIPYGIYESSLGIQTNIRTLMYLVKDVFLDDDNLLVQDILSTKYETNIKNHLLFCRGMYCVDSDKNYTIYTHAGHSNRHSSAIHFVPETKTGIVILSNSQIGTKDLSLLVLRMINHNWKTKTNG